MKLRKKIIKIISEHLGIPENQLESDHELEKDLNASPIEKTDLFLKLEDQFKIKIETEDFKRAIKIEDIVNYITETLGEF